jgi:hypothetical protein
MVHSLTDYVAFYGACVATLSLVVAAVALVWNIKNYYRDRARLKIEAMVGRIFPPPMDPRLVNVINSGAGPTLHKYAPDLLKELLENSRMDTDKPLLIITLTNEGRRPILAQKIGFELKNRIDGAIGGILLTRFLPKKLEESESVTEWTDSMEFLTKNLKKISAWDSTGKEWRLPENSLKSIIRQADELRTKGED